MVLRYILRASGRFSDPLLLGRQIWEESSEQMRTMGRILRQMALGWAAFWIPDIIIHALRREKFSGIDMVILTLLLPLTLIITYRIALLIMRTSRPGSSVAGFMLLGLWEFGSIAMMISASFYGAGFFSLRWNSLTVVALGLFPPYTFIMSGYDGSLIGLILATIFMIAMGYKYEPTNWIIPPGAVEHLRRRSEKRHQQSGINKRSNFDH